MPATPPPTVVSFILCERIQNEALGKLSLLGLFNAFTAPDWKWLHGILGALFIVTGAIAFARPGGTFAMLAAFVGWYLLFKGMLDIVLAFVILFTELRYWKNVIVLVALPVLVLVALVL